MSSKYRGWAFERARESERLHWNSTWPIRAFGKTQRPPSLCTGTARRTLGTLALALPEGFLHWHCQSASHSAGTARGPLAMALRECLSPDTLSPDTLSPHSHFCIARGPLQLIRSFLSNSLYFLLVCTLVCMCISMYMHEYKYSVVFYPPIQSKGSSSVQIGVYVWSRLPIFSFSCRLQLRPVASRQPK